jgi:hypothetical protein
MIADKLAALALAAPASPAQPGSGVFRDALVGHVGVTLGGHDG